MFKVLAFKPIRTCNTRHPDKWATTDDLGLSDNGWNNWKPRASTRRGFPLESITSIYMEVTFVKDWGLLVSIIISMLSMISDALHPVWACNRGSWPIDPWKTKDLAVFATMDYKYCSINYYFSPSFDTGNKSYWSIKHAYFSCSYCWLYKKMTSYIMIYEN